MIEIKTPDPLLFPDYHIGRVYRKHLQGFLDEATWQYNHPTDEKVQAETLLFWGRLSLLFRFLKKSPRLGIGVSSPFSGFEFWLCHIL